MKVSLEGASVFIATFSLYEKCIRTPKNGMVEPMLSYFAPRVKHLLLIDQPHPLSDTVDPFIEEYYQSRLRSVYRLHHFWYLPIYLYCRLEKGLIRLSYKFRDFFSVLLIGLTRKSTYDLFIGLEAINVLAGLILKQLGKVKHVVYYVSDYSPNRFSKHGKKVFNTIYIWLDRFCVTHADFTWDVSQEIHLGRIKAGLRKDKSYSVIHVPNALFPEHIKSLPILRRKEESLVYVGTLEPDFGVELAIESLLEIRKIYPHVQLRIIGGGDDLVRLKNFAKKLHLQKSVIFYGYVNSNSKMAEIVRSSYIGLAPYRAFKESIRWYGDAGKIRQYVASGLPVVTTHVPPLGREIVQKGAGIMAKDTVASFSEAILRLLDDRALYKSLTLSAIKFSKNNTWERVYTRTVDAMQRKINIF